MQKDPQNPSNTPSSEDSEAGVQSVPVRELTRPAGVWVVTAVVALEALTLGILAVWAIFSALSQPMSSTASGVFLIVLIAALAVGLGAVALNAFKGMRWTRSAALVWQLLMVAIAVPALLEGQIVLGLALLLPPLLTAYYLFTPKVVEFSQRTGDENKIL